MSIEIWFAFALASVALLAIPGLTISTVVSYSIAQGRRANIPLVAAVALATLNATLYAVFASSVRKMLVSRRAQRCFNLVGGTLLSSAGVWALLAKRPA